MRAGPPAFKEAANYSRKVASAGGIPSAAPISAGLVMPWYSSSRPIAIFNRIMVNQSSVRRWRSSGKIFGFAGGWLLGGNVIYHSPPGQEDDRCAVLSMRRARWLWLLHLPLRMPVGSKMLSKPSKSKRRSPSRPRLSIRRRGRPTLRRPSLSVTCWTRRWVTGSGPLRRPSTRPSIPLSTRPSTRPSIHAEKQGGERAPPPRLSPPASPPRRLPAARRRPPHRSQRVPRELGSALPPSPRPRRAPSGAVGVHDMPQDGGGA
ncbi:hypothetical protein SAMN04487779_10644 [Belnapia rosea]|uniref:Uncharacterized protein n=1 Tax=Belnapia rosea TaxID=938405 RepID=A0A1G7E867_9PROT|nr:hypothetical protein SAMN04487779_10644 [Belnapia rosea]